MRQYCDYLRTFFDQPCSEYNKELGSIYKNQDISWVGDNTLKKVSSEENFYTVQCSPEFSHKYFDQEYDKTNKLLEKELISIFGDGYDILSNHKWRYSIPKNYYPNSDISLNGNYSWNSLNEKGTNDPIIPAYNTPEHKFNLGCLVKNIHFDKQKSFLRDYSFSINFC